MKTIDEVTEAARAWLEQHSELPRVLTPVVEDEYAEGMRVTVAFVPDTFGSFMSSPPIATLIYRLDRNGLHAWTPVAPDFVRDVGFGPIHEITLRAMAGH